MSLQDTQKSINLLIACCTKKQSIVLDRMEINSFFTLGGMMALVKLLSEWEMPIGMIKCVIRSLAQVSAIFYLKREACWRWLNLSRWLF